MVNGENSAGGMGITAGTAEEIFSLGADVITLGNHSYRHRDAYDYLDETERVIRPANYRRGNPGHGSVVVEAAGACDGGGQPQRHGRVARGALAVRRSRPAGRPARE